MGPADSEGTNADLIIKVSIRKEDLIERKGDDLYVDVFVDFFSFILGGSAKIKTFGGTVKFNISAGTQNGKLLKIPKMGMPRYDNSNETGDLYLMLNVKLPENLKDEEKLLVKKWRDMIQQ
jgi:curved DNA-binding protein